MRQRMTVVEKELLAQIEIHNPNVDGGLSSATAAKALTKSLVGSLMPALGLNRV